MVHKSDSEISESFSVDDVIEELDYNNRKIRQPHIDFWRVVTRYILDRGYDDGFVAEITEKTDFGKTPPLCCFNSEYSSGVEPVRHDFYFGNLSRTDGFSSMVFYDFRLSVKKKQELDPLVGRNSQLLRQLLSYALHQTVVPKKGLYPYCGIDIETLLDLPGKWTMIEPCEVGQQYDRMLSIWPQAEQEIREGRIAWETEFMDVVPDAVLIKCPTPGGSVAEIINKYQKHKPLIICDQPNIPLHPRTIPALGTNGFATERASLSGGGIAYPLTSFYLFSYT